jgi:hypothetical protein
MAENLFKINGIEYEFECTIRNKDGETSYNKYAVKKMQIIDDLFDPFTSGNIALVNSYDLIEEDFLIRGDGTDTIKIKFKPKDDDENDFEHVFVPIKDINMGNIDTRADNTKAFILIDINNVPFLEKVPHNKTYKGKVGDLLREIFIEVLGEEMVDVDNWESCDFSLSYTPPNTFRYIDLVKYLMPFLCIKENDLYVKALLKFDNKNNKFYLKKISKIFSKNNELAKEAFIVSDIGGNNETINPNNPPAGPEYAAYLNQLKNFQVSTPLYDWNNNYFLNYMVHGYDPMMGQFKMRKIEFEKLTKDWKELFVDVFPCIGGKPKPYLPISDDAKKRFKTVKTPYPLEDSVKAVISEICNTLIFYNLQCSFEIVGSGKRSAGGFVDVVKTGNETIKSDEKAYGRWLVTNVTHEFLGETYKNIIVGCKTYVGPESKI